MKKKLALLLVLAMVLSAVPMNVLGTTTINRGPYQTEANNTYARVNVDIRQLAEKGFVGIHTNVDYDGSGYLGIPIEVVLSDNGGSFILDDTYGLPDGQSAAISSNNSEILASIYATNYLQNLWSVDTGSARRTTIETGNGLSTNEVAKAWVGITSAASNNAESVIAGILGNDPVGVLDDMMTTSAITSSAAAYVPQEYDTKWTARYIDSRHVRFYLQVFNATTGQDVIPDVGALAENALTIDFAVPMYMKDQNAIGWSTLTVNALTNQFSVELASGPAVNYGYIPPTPPEVEEPEEEGATVIIRGPYQTEPNNTYARIKVDIKQIAEKGFVGVHTNVDHDGSGYLGIPIEVTLSDNGGSFILDDHYGLPDGQTASISSNTDVITASIYATNALQNLWTVAEGSARTTTIETGTGNLTAASALAWTGATSATSNTIETTVKGLIGSDPVGWLAALTAGSSVTSAYVPQQYNTKWTVRYIDSRHLRFYLQVFNTATGLDVIPDVGALAKNALTIDFAVPMYLKDQDAIEKSTLTVNALTNQFSTELVSGPAVNFGYYSSLMVSTSTIAKIANTGFLDTLKVGEYRANFLNGYGYTNDTTVAAKAPSVSIGVMEFRFESPYARLVNNVDSPLTFADYANTFTKDDAVASDDTVTTTWGTRTVNDYDLQLTFNNRYASGVSTVKGGATSIADTLSLKNLAVAFDDRMPYDSELKLQYRTKTNTEILKGEAGVYSDWTDTAAPVVVRVRDNVPPPAKDDLQNILDGITDQTTAEDIIDKVIDIPFADLETAIDDEETANIIKDLEDQYKAKAGVSVNVDVANNTHGNFASNKNDISVVGAGLNAQPGQTVSLSFTPPAKNVVIDGARFKGNNAVQMDISLLIDNVAVPTRLTVPVMITVPVPTGVDPQDFVILHYKDNGTYDVITPKLSADRKTCSFSVSRFSVFVFTNKVAQAPAVPAYNPPSNSGERTYYYTPQPSAPAKVYTASDSSEDGSPSAEVAVPVKTDAKGNVSFSVTNAMIQPGISKARVALSKLKKAEREKGVTVEIVPSASGAINGMTVKLDKSVLTKLADADMGFGIYSDSAFVELDNAAVNELVKQNRTAFTFSIRPVLKPGNYLNTLTDGHTIYNVFFRDSYGRDISSVSSGGITYGFRHEIEDDENIESVKVMQIVKNRGVIVSDSIQDGGWLTWTSNANGTFSVGKLESLPPSAE